MDGEITQELEKKFVLSRRGFLRTIGWGSVMAFLGASLAATVRFFFPKVLYEPSTSFTANRPEEYPVGSVTVDKPHRVFIVREEDRLYAIISICTHLGCTPRWFGEEGIYMCPCHGSRYYKNGVRFYGPAPRPMDRAAISLAPDGRILIDTSKKFSSDGKSYGKGYVGDWDNHQSFLDTSGMGESTDIHAGHKV